MLVIISKVLVVFIYIGVGFFACKGGLIRQDSVPALNMLVLNIASPCLLISSITSRRLNDSLFRNTLITFFLSIALFILMSALTLWISRRTGMEDKAKANVLAVGMTACNSGFMGFPIAQSVFGDTVFDDVALGGRGGAPLARSIFSRFGVEKWGTLLYRPPRVPLFL